MDGHGPTRLRDIVRERADVLLVIALGGALGSLARWGVAELVPHRAGEWALSTLLVNVVGSFVLGALMVHVLEVRATPGRHLRPFLGVGVLGGFTTFSTAMLDLHTQIEAGRWPLALAGVATTVVLVLLAVAAGVAGARTTARLLHEPRHPVAPSDEPEVE